MSTRSLASLLGEYMWGDDMPIYQALYRGDSMRDGWEPTTPQVYWEWEMRAGDPLDGETWPHRITLQAWERNEMGERRIRATRDYVPAKVTSD